MRLIYICISPKENEYCLFDISIIHKMIFPVNIVNLSNQIVNLLLL